MPRNHSIHFIKLTSSISTVFFFSRISFYDIAHIDGVFIGKGSRTTYSFIRAFLSYSNDDVGHHESHRSVPTTPLCNQPTDHTQTSKAAKAPVPPSISPLSLGRSPPPRKPSCTSKPSASTAWTSSSAKGCTPSPKAPPRSSAWNSPA